MERMSRALAFVPAAHSDLPRWLSNLGASHIDRFKRLKELGDLAKAIEYISRALTLAADGDPDQPKRLNDLTEFHTHRFQRLGELRDLEKAMGYMLRLMVLTPDGHPDQPKRLNHLGELHSYRFNRLGELNDIEKAIEFGHFALALTPDDHPDLPKRLNDLGGFHGSRFQRLGDLGDLEMAMNYTLRAMNSIPDGHPDLPCSLNNLGSFHSNRFRRLGDLADLEKAIECGSHALALTPDDHPDLPKRLNDLGEFHGDRFRRLGELGDLEKAIECASHALALTPDGHPDLAKWFNNLGIFHSDRFRRLGDLADLEKAIEYGSHALALTPDDHPDLPKRLNDLGEFHGDRFRRLGELGDLEKAIEYISRAVALTPDGHPDMPCKLNNLGAFYSDRFRQLGKLDDIERAIEYCSRALALTPDDHPDLPKRLNDLGEFHGDRFRRLGELGDLEKAIEYISRAVALTPDGHPNLAKWFNNLGIFHSDRFRRLGELADLEKAIEYGSHALALTPDDHPDLPKRLNDLGEFHGDRLRHLGELGDLEKAIEYISRAVALTPDGHPDLAKRLSGLGESHCDRFQRLNMLEDLGQATIHANRALDLTPEGHPSLPARHFLLARVHFFKYESTDSDLYLQDTSNSFRMASKSSAGSPGTKFQIALDWAAFTHSYNPPGCIEAYQAAIDLLPQYIWLGATTNQRYQDLEIAVNLAVDAASAAILISDSGLALEWLDHGRCVVWNQSLMLRSPLDELHASYPALATRLQVVANQLHRASSETRESRALTSGFMTPEQVGQEHRRLAMEYESLLSQSRKLPGFGDFLRPMKANLLVRAARNGPIIVINCHTAGCDALLILPGQNNIGHVPLLNFTGEKAKLTRLEMEKSVRSGNSRERSTQRRPILEDFASDFEQTMRTLWYDIVQPVLEFLGYTDNVSEDSLPHVTWCPTSMLSFLPLHAAGDYDQPRSRVFDYVISSYTPTLTALLASAPSVWDHDCRVLAIGQANTPGHSPLPDTVEELAYVRAHTQVEAKYTQLVNDQATTTAVLDAMEQHDWVHFACHAHQNVDDPTKSGFFLHNDILDLVSINQRSFKNKGLAYLSACQTAKGDEKLPDEAVHLASGMLMAGFTSVIATMWSVVDEDAPFVADKVYAQLMKDRKLGNGEAGKALHNAVAGLREEVGEKAFERWAPYIHIGS